MVNKSKKSKREFSAGGVVYKKKGKEIKWLVCKHSGYHKWVLPKGLVEKGESLKNTAVREIKEECGIKTRMVCKISDPERYVYTMNGLKIFKQVNYFLMEYVSGDIKDHDWEMEEVEWRGFDEAYRRLNFHGVKQILDKGRKLLEEKERQLELI